MPLYCALVKMKHPSLLTLVNKGRTQGLHGEEESTRNSLLGTVHGCASGYMASRSRATPPHIDWKHQGPLEVTQSNLLCKQGQPQQILIAAYYQLWVSLQPLGNLIQCLTFLTINQPFLMFQCIFLCLGLCPLPFIHSLDTLRRSWLSLLSLLPSAYILHTEKIPLQFHLSRLESRRSGLKKRCSRNSVGDG